MSKIALYRKYRPYNFKNLVGQDNIKNALVNALKSDNPAHAYLFCGPRGTGKTTTARLIAKAINCENLEENHEPCNECQFCTSINDGSLIDLLEVDAASNRGIDEIRDLKEKINFAPSRAKTKVYIIDEVHMMTKEAFNALLKTLEEPPSYVYFILATTEVHKIPETIISRCQRFDFKRIDSKSLMTRLSYIAQLEEIKAEDKAIEAIARHVEGSLRDAIQLLEQLTVDGKLSFVHVQDILGVSDFETLDKLFVTLMDDDTDGALKTIQDVHSQGYDLNQFCHEFIDIIRNRLLEAVEDNQEELIARYLRTVEIFQKAKNGLKTYTIPQLPLEIAVIEATKNLEQVVAPEKSAKAKAPKSEPKPESKPEAKAESEPEAEPEPAPEPEVPKPNSTTPLTISYVKEHWPRITERVDIPACKRSLMDGEIATVDGNEVMVEFRSNFHRNKVMEHDNRVVIEGIFEEVFGQKVKIIGRVKEIEIDSAVSRSHKDLDEPVASNDTKDELTDQALEIFGGELLEEDEFSS
jgi:DNA polymerase III subunit gamma/tau